MVTWKGVFSLGGGADEIIELFDAASLVDWDPEFKGKYIQGFFETYYTWVPGALKEISRGDVRYPTSNFLMVVGRKWGEQKKKSVPLGILFEFSEGDLKLRAIGPKSLSEKTGGDSNILLNYIDELFDKPDLWKSKTIISAKSKSEWKILADSIEEKPWDLIDQGRKIARTDPKRAIENFNKASMIFDVLNDKNGKFHAVFALAELYLDLNNFDTAKNYLDRARDLATQLGDSMLEENVLSTEGIILYEQKLYEQAAAKFELALERARKANKHDFVVNAYSNIGECYYRMGDLDKSMENFEKAHSLSEERNDKQNLARSKVNMAKVLKMQLKRGDSSSQSQAEWYLNDALTIFEDSTDILGIMSVYGERGELEELAGNFESALIYFENASEKATELKAHQFQEYYRYKAQKMKNKLYEI
ncbi:MAG: tetratricopeptide repeat protein [Candidatus Hodarchaeales archaeon]